MQSQRICDHHSNNVLVADHDCINDQKETKRPQHTDKSSGIIVRTSVFGNTVKSYHLGDLYRVVR